MPDVYVLLKVNFDGDLTPDAAARLKRGIDRALENQISGKTEVVLDDLITIYPVYQAVSYGNGRAYYGARLTREKAEQDCAEFRQMNPQGAYYGTYRVVTTAEALEELVAADRDILQAALDAREDLQRIEQEEVERAERAAGWDPRP